MNFRLRKGKLYYRLLEAMEEPIQYVPSFGRNSKQNIPHLGDVAAQQIWQVDTLCGAPDANFEEEDNYFANQLIEKFRTTT